MPPASSQLPTEQASQQHPSSFQNCSYPYSAYPEAGGDLSTDSSDFGDRFETISLPHRKAPYLLEGVVFNNSGLDSRIRIHQGTVEKTDEPTAIRFKSAFGDKPYPAGDGNPEALWEQMKVVIPPCSKYGEGRTLLLMCTLSQNLVVPRGLGFSFPLLAMPKEKYVPVLIHRVIDPSTELYRAKPDSTAAFTQAITERDIPVFRVGRGIVNSASELVAYQHEAGYGSVPMILWKGGIKEGEHLLRYAPDQGRPLDASWPAYHRIAAEVDRMAADIFHGLLHLGARVLHRWWNEPVWDSYACAHDFIRWVSLSAEEMDLTDEAYDALMASLNDCVSVIKGTDELLIRL